ncbi:MAG: T9SS type A sorting domain-containing protein [Bacteroidetes bacterium]|nr:T9SS type A sorting domain-containing protein [Bacteroidota bacterium]MBU1580496.1 T9SS type A sorting domain-containing protein [Bacteroidota bacterium]MBU2556441.1 T9SS type A sorting domain-containing protein [Bacteroidota bacterium]
MINRIIFSVLLFAAFLPMRGNAQFAPPAGEPGTDAIHADSACFINWATTCLVSRGLMQIDNQALGSVTFGDETDALDKADNIVVSLGDGGEALLQFEFPIWNGPGFDFAVFENSFTDSFLELAHVAVSSDGLTFFTFPSISFTQTDEQVDGFGSLDATKIHHLAGKYRAFYGTPFDLDSLPDSPLLDKMSITHIRVTDVVGKLDSELGTYDSKNHLINDPWPSPFPSSGFDLDGIGVIHDASNLQVLEASRLPINLYPNPFANRIYVRNFDHERMKISIFNNHGIQLVEGVYSENIHTIWTSAWESGIYLIRIESENKVYNFKMLKL